MSVSKVIEIPQQEKPKAYLLFALLILAAVNMQDGFDILAISFAANAISKDWGITRTELGIVFSAGLLGMMLGAIFLASLADKFGRKVITITGLFLSGTGMLLAMVAPNIEVLIAARILTGFGVGGILASVNTLVSEYAFGKYKVGAVALFQLGFPFGAFLSGFIVAWLLKDGSWRHIFAFGAFTSFFFIPFIALLPESSSYLLKKGGADALEKVNVTRQKFGQAPLLEMPKTDAAQKVGLIENLKLLLSKPYRTKTLLIWSAFFLLLTTLYFLLSWVPKMIVDMGFLESDGNKGGRTINFMGMIGIVGIGALGFKFRPTLITTFYMLGLAVLMFTFSHVELNLSTLFLFLTLIGICVHGSMIGLYSTVPSLYPASIRASGTGWAIGISRFGAVLGPATAGVLFDGGWTPQGIFKLFAIPAILTAIAVFWLWRVERRHDIEALS